MDLLQTDTNTCYASQKKQYVVGSVPSSPVLLSSMKKHKLLSLDELSVLPALNVSDSCNVTLELLRDQLKAAKIPISKHRGSIAEVPQFAVDCHIMPGTSRCSLPLCSDSCDQSHAHHRSHQQLVTKDALLIYSRPSISMAQGAQYTQCTQYIHGTPELTTGPTSPSGLPDDSQYKSKSNSTNTSPQQQYRRASAFGFSLGNRGSITGSQLLLSGLCTPADFASRPPSPQSTHPSEPTSAYNSPRPHMDSSHTIPRSIAEEQPNVSSTSQSCTLASINMWRLNNRIINLMDYSPAMVGKLTEDSKTRCDLKAAARDDWEDQEHPAWDPRSPQPPSPVLQSMEVDILGINVNTEDHNRAEVEYILKLRSLPLLSDARETTNKIEAQEDGCCLGESNS